MTWNLKELLGLVVETIRNPREGASTLLNFTPHRSVLWQMLLLVVVLSVLLAHGTALLIPTNGGDVLSGPFALSPMVTGLTQGALLVIMVYTTYWIGKAFGGTGSFEETLFLITWLQFVLVCLQVIQTFALIAAPPIGGLIGIASLVLFFWLLVNFIAVLHGFSSLGLVLAGILLSAFGVIFGLSILLTLIGITVPGVTDV